MSHSSAEPKVSNIAQRVAELVRIPSVNPLHAGPSSGDDGERALSVHLADRLDAMGADVVIHDVEDGRANVYARFAGASDRVVAIDAHLDTVGVEHMTRNPFDGAIEHGRVYGRGSVDTKATFGVIMHVLDELRSEKGRPVPTVDVVGTIAEESGRFAGAVAYADRLRDEGRSVDQLIVAEPTSCRPVHGHKGGLGLEVSVHGRAAHSSQPHLGENAITAAARIVAALDREHGRLIAVPPQTGVGPATLAVTTITGGRGLNVIPDLCELFVDRRVIPEEDLDSTRDRLIETIRSAAAPLNIDVGVIGGRGFPAFYQAPDSPLVELLASLAESGPETATYGSNALMYADIAREIVVFGPGSIDQAHQAEEWVEITELERAASVYRRFLSM